MMEYVEDHDLGSAISWTLNGRAFTINDPEKLVEILPKFFGQTKYRSFRRQLNMWHFQRILEGPDRGAFMHPYFIRGNRQMCSSMSRYMLPQSSNDSLDQSMMSEASLSQRQAAVRMEGEQRSSMIGEHVGTAIGAAGHTENVLIPAFNGHMQMNETTAIAFNSGRIVGNLSMSAVDDYQQQTEPSLRTLPWNQTINYTARDPVNVSMPRMSNLYRQSLDHRDTRDEKIDIFEAGAIRLTESPIIADSENKLPGISISDFDDGDPVFFAGRRFHFLGNKGKNFFDKEPHPKSSYLWNLVDPFADDAPIIASDALLEPIDQETVDSIFSSTP
jgi:hypothetical protein